MDCPNLDEFKFSTTSKDAIEDIRRRQDLIKALGVATGLGTWATIFVGNNSLDMSIALGSADFEIMGKALKSLPIMQRRVIETIALKVYLEFPGSISYEESRFWKAVASGCSF